MVFVGKVHTYLTSKRKDKKLAKAMSIQIKRRPAPQKDFLCAPQYFNRHEIRIRIKAQELLTTRMLHIEHRRSKAH